MALNDPNWGRRGNSEGPPDLDELWRKLTQKLNKLLGGRGTGGPTEPGGPSLFARLPGGAGLVVAIAIALWLASGFYIVDASQRGVVLRFGKYLETTQPGLQWHIPFPVESAEIVNVSQVRTVEVGYRANVKSKVLKESLMLTDDENIIDLQFAVQYLVKNPEDFLFNNRNPDEAVMQAAETAIREVVGKSKMDFVLYEGREQVAASVQKLLQEILDRYQTGIEVSKVTMQNAQPPEQVQAAFDDAVKASQDRERLKNEGQAYANDVIPRAAGMASRLNQEAEGYRQRVIASAEGDASRFRQVLVEYQKAPAVTRDRMYLDTMQQIFSNVTKVLVDQKGGNNLLMLPLDKLIQMSSGSTAATDTAPKPPMVPEATPPTDTTNRSREAFRGRERESRQ
ncbi:MAG: FtsH protease activity modulator HflK [Burkholderiales bacterium]